MADCLLVIERDETGSTMQTAMMLSAWMLPIPEGQTAEQVANDFAEMQSFQLGAIARVIDLSMITNGMSTWKLKANWILQENQ